MKKLPVWSDVAKDQSSSTSQPDVTCYGNCEVVPAPPPSNGPSSDGDKQTANKYCDTPEELDLIAQSVMAHWTSYITGFTALGLIVLIMTLIEARMSGEKVAGVTREIGEAQLRPYPMIMGRSKIRYGITDTGSLSLTLTLKFGNAGETPAFEPGVTIRLFFWEPGPRDFTKGGCVLEETFDGLGTWAAKSNDFEMERTLNSSVAMIEQSVKDVARHDEPKTGHAYVHLEVLVNARDYAKRALPTYAVYVESDGTIPYRQRNHVGHHALSHPWMIRPGAAGYSKP